MSSRVRIAGLLAVTALAACVPRPAAQPTRPRPAAPAPVPPPVALAPDWQDWPVTPGNWSYTRETEGSLARYSGASGLVLSLRCDNRTRVVTLGRPGQTASTDGSAMMTVRTTSGVLQWPARSMPGEPPIVDAPRSASDAGLDWIAYSRGRFAVEIPGSPPLVAPNWAEPARVIEDCRS